LLNIGTRQYGEIVFPEDGVWEATMIYIMACIVGIQALMLWYRIIPLLLSFINSSQTITYNFTLSHKIDVQ